MRKAAINLPYNEAFIPSASVHLLGVEMEALNEEQKTILKTLTKLEEPAGCKVIGENAGIPWRTVMGKLRGLRKDAYVESPVKGKYIITDKGRAAVA